MKEPPDPFLNIPPTLPLNCCLPSHLSFSSSHAFNYEALYSQPPWQYLDPTKRNGSSEASPIRCRSCNLQKHFPSAATGLASLSSCFLPKSYPIIYGDFGPIDMQSVTLLLNLPTLTVPEPYLANHDKSMVSKSNLALGLRSLSSHIYYAELVHYHSYRKWFLLKSVGDLELSIPEGDHIGRSKYHHDDLSDLKTVTHPILSVYPLPGSSAACFFNMVNLSHDYGICIDSIYVSTRSIEFLSARSVSLKFVLKSFRFSWLFIDLHPQSKYPKPYLSLPKWVCLEHMSANSPFTPVPPITNSNGSMDHQDHVSPPPDPTQPGIPTVLDGSRCNTGSQPAPSFPDTYSDALKLGMGSHSGTKISTTESELCPKFRQSKLTGNLSVGHSSHNHIPDQSTHDPDPQVPQHSPISLDELLACCLLGKVWGEPLPLPAIIHRTRNEWKSVKGHVKYVEMGKPLDPH